MSLLQETCGAITGRSLEIERHIIDSWNTASPVERYGRLVNMVAQYGAATNQETLAIPKPCMIILSHPNGRFLWIRTDAHIGHTVIGRGNYHARLWYS